MQKFTERPLAGLGLHSYRYPGAFGWVMIGARDKADALNEAQRSTRQRARPELLQQWDADLQEYVAA